MAPLSLPAVPRAIGPIVGREAELKHLIATVLHPDTSMVTITGPGGVGKTRLAQHLGLALEPLVPDGVAYIRMGAITAAQDGLPHIARSFGWDGSNPADAVTYLAQTLTGQNMVIILDNLEQIILDQPSLIHEYAQLPHSITWVGTSQVSLGVPGEHVFPLAPLAVPGSLELPPQQLRDFESLQLFALRAATVNPDFQLKDSNINAVADICIKLEGLPLALELAAMRTRVLPPSSLAERLNDGIGILSGGGRATDPRHRTLTSAIAWSFESLEPNEQSLFLAVSQLVTGFQLDAIDFIGGRNAQCSDPLDCLDALMERGFVRILDPAATEPRYIMLAPLRAFAVEHLEATGMLAETRGRVVDYLVALTSNLSERILTAERARAIARFNAEQLMIVTAIEWAQKAGDFHHVLHLATNMYRFFENAGIGDACCGWIEDALAHSDPPQNLAALAYNCLGFLYEGRRELERAIQAYERARELALSIQSPLHITTALNGLGMCAHDAGRLSESEEWLQESRSIAAAAGETRNFTVAVSHLATIAFYREDWVTAERLLLEALNALTSSPQPAGASTILNNLGVAAIHQDKIELAASRFHEAQTWDRKSDDRFNLAVTLANYSECLALLGDTTGALDCIAESRDIVNATGLTWLNDVLDVNTALAAVVRNDPVTAAHHVGTVAERADAANPPRALFEAASLLATVVHRQGKHQETAELLEISWTIQEQLESKPNLRRQADEQQMYQFLADALGPDRRDQTHRAIRGMSAEARRQRVVNIAHDVVGPLYRTNAAALSVPTAPPPDYGLTAREREVLAMLCNGLSTREIADSLYVSPRTITTHVANILGKLEVSSRAAAVGIAMRDRLV